MIFYLVAYRNIIAQETEGHLEGRGLLTRLRAGIVIEQSLDVKRLDTDQFGLAWLEIYGHLDRLL